MADIASPIKTLGNFPAVDTTVAAIGTADQIADGTVRVSMLADERGSLERLPEAKAPVFVRAAPDMEPRRVAFAVRVDASGRGVPVLTGGGRLVQLRADGIAETVILRDEVAAADEVVLQYAQDVADSIPATDVLGMRVGGVPVAFGVVDDASGRGVPLVRQDGRLVHLLPTGAADLTPLARTEKLRRAAQRAAARNPEDADIAVGVTLTVNSATDAALSQSFLASSNMDLFSFAGGRAIANSSGSSVYFPVSSVAPSTAGNVGTVDTIPDDQSAWGWRASFGCDADRIEIRTNAAAGGRFRIVVDGRYISKTPHAQVGTGFVDYIVLDFAGVRQPRTITLEASDTTTLRGVSIGPTASIWRPAADPDRIVALATGDSYSEGQGTTSPGVMAWTQTLGRLMGWTDVRQVAVGGTGYFNTGPGGARSKIYDQIDRWLSVNSDIKAADVDVVTVAAGYNDYVAVGGVTYTPAEIAAEAQRCWRKIRETLPWALIVVFGPWSGLRGPDARTIDIEAALAAAFAAWGDPYSLFVPVSPSASRAWIKGTGRVGATTGSGNSDIATSSDGVHPTDFGHTLIARHGADAIRAALALS